MRRLILILVFLSLPAFASAQPNAIVSTLKTTNTSATSVCVGCTVGGTTSAANSGMKVATISMEQLAAPSITTNRIYSVAGALYFNGASLATGGSVIGTTNTIGMFTGPTAVGNSIITQNGGATLVTVTGALTVTGTVTGNLFSGSGASLVSIPTTALTGNFVAQALGGTGITSSVTSGSAAVTTISLNNTAVTPTAYGGATTLTSFTVDQQGRLTAAANVAPTYTFTKAAAGDVIIFTNGGGTPKPGYLYSDATFVGLMSGAGATGQGLLATTTATGLYVGGNAIFSTTATAATLAASLTATKAAAGDVLVFTNGGGTPKAGYLYSDATFVGLANTAGLGGSFQGFIMTATGANIYAGGNPVVSNTSTLTTLTNNVAIGGANITDAVAAPTIASGFGTGPSIAGKASFFVVTTGTGSPTTGTVNFNATFANPPACVAMTDINLSVANEGIIASSNTTTVQITTKAGASFQNITRISVFCRGF